MLFKSQQTLEETKQIVAESVAEYQRLQSELDRIKQAKSDLRTAIQNQGVPVPDSAKIDTYSTYVDGISTVRSVADVLPDDRGNVPLAIDDLNGLSDIKVVSTSTAESGTPASVEVVKSGSVANLSFIIPKGEEGKAATIEVGTVTTGEPGTQAQVVNSGTSSAATFDFTIPRGDQGLKGDKGNDGYTPVKGTDYWTESDKSEITNYVLNNVAHKYIDYTLESQSWTSGGEDIFLLSFSDPRIPSDCKLELSLDTQNLIQLMNDGVMSIRADNNEGTVEVICLGSQPSTDLNVQISFVKIVQV